MVVLCGRESRNSFPVLPGSAGSSSGPPVDHDPNVPLVGIKWQICWFCHGKLERIAISTVGKGDPDGAVRVM